MRERVAETLYGDVEMVSYVVADAAHIDYVGNIWSVWRVAVAYLTRLNWELGVPLVWVDGKQPGAVRCPECLFDPRITYEVRADAWHKEVSAASIVAKDIHTACMEEIDEQYPEYGFGSHSGYGTVKHREQLDAHGICPAHRVSYNPIAKRAGQDFRRPVDRGSIKAYIAYHSTVYDLGDYCGRRYCYPGRDCQRCVYVTGKSRQTVASRLA